VQQYGHVVGIYRRRWRSRERGRKVEWEGWKKEGEKRGRKKV